eukprot:scaffold438_cov110-Isochrysis_galbana.AAC.5
MRGEPRVAGLHGAHKQAVCWGGGRRAAHSRADRCNPASLGTSVRAGLGVHVSRGASTGLARPMDDALAVGLRRGGRGVPVGRVSEGSRCVEGGGEQDCGCMQGEARRGHNGLDLV